jgi:hypothetical protein
MPGARCARSLACKSRKHASKSLRSHRKTPGIPYAMALTLIPCSPRRSGLFVTVACGVFSASLTPASRRQDHTTSPSALAPFVISAVCVHRIPSRVRDDREPPLWGTGRLLYAGDLGLAKTRIFLQRGLDSEIADLPVVGQISATRMVPTVMRPNQTSFWMLAK